MTTSPQRPDILKFLTERVARLTKQTPDAITEDANLVDIGLQSIDAVLLCGEVEDTFAIELDPATIFEHETLGSFAADIRTRIATA